MDATQGIRDDRDRAHRARRADHAQPAGEAQRVLSPTLQDELIAAVHAGGARQRGTCHRHPWRWAVVLRGLRHQSLEGGGGEDPPADPRAGRRVTISYGDRWANLWNCRIPVIAQVHGHCIAGGTDIALHCDLVGCRGGREDRLPAGAVAGCAADAHVAVPRGPAVDEAIAAHRRHDLRRAGRRDRARARSRAARASSHDHVLALGRAHRHDRPRPARAQQAHREPGRRAHGPVDDAGARRDPRRARAQRCPRPSPSARASGRRACAARSTNATRSSASD